MAEKKTLSKIKSGVLSRGFSLARASVSAGARAAGYAVGNILASPEERGERLKALLTSQMSLITRELGELKGSLMKVGQLLSTYGEHFLPPEANHLLKSLQSESPPLEWKAIEKALKRHLGAEKLAMLEIDPTPIASASLGQVHRARLKTGGPWLAMKIQYPGVDAAIDGDLKALRTLLTVAKLIPNTPSYDHLFDEVKSMLHQEVDYSRELEQMEAFRAALAGDDRFVIPEAVPEFCTRRVLTMKLEEGLKVDSPEVRALPLERRNAISLAVLELYFKELFALRMMQTDPHFGNYRVRPGKDGAADQLILFDFGAVRKFTKTFLDSYREMVTGAFRHDQEGVVKGASKLGFLLPGDPPELYDMFSELCFLITEPFAGSAEPYSWGESDLPKRVAKKAGQMVLKFKLHAPPSEIVFLDRKMGGIFVFLSVLGARIQARGLLGKYLD